MFGKRTKSVHLTNTLSGKKEELHTRTKGTATLYSCGPTVYGPAHIGNLRSYVFSDTLSRTLKEAGYKVRRVINITDVGHLVGDGDDGEDKMQVGAVREQTTPKAIADRYTKKFKEDISALNIPIEEIRFPRATEFIAEQVAMIRALEKKGYTYKTKDGVYFDTAKFPAYGALGNFKEASIEAGARIALGEKKNPHDFALWRTAKPNDLQQWDSPWGKGNPGWSIECSAMATELLGPQIDIHTGGEDHIQVHHNNEIAQSECANGKSPFVGIWMHHAFITINGDKVAKSAGNTFTLEDVRARGINPLALRYFFLQANYRSPLSFTWEALEAAHSGLQSLWAVARTTQEQSGGKTEPSEALDIFVKNMRDDLMSPKALALLWQGLVSNGSPTDSDLRKQWGLLVTAEKYLGLSLTNPPKKEEAPPELLEIAKEREEARKNKDFAKSDELRIHIEKRGYRVEDTPSGPVLTKIEK